MHHARDRQLTHSSETTEGTETNDGLHTRKGYHGTHSASDGLQDSGLLHPEDISLLLIAGRYGSIQLLLQRASQGLQRGHGSHPVGAECLEDKHAAAHNDGGRHDGARPAPAGLEIDRLEQLLKQSRDAVSVVQPQLRQLAGVVDELCGIEVGLEDRVLDRLGAGEQLVQRLLIERRRCTLGGRDGVLCDGGLVDACGRYLGRGGGDFRLECWCVRVCELGRCGCV